MRIVRKLGSGSVLLLLAVVLGLATSAASYSWLATRADGRATATHPGLTGAMTSVVVVRDEVAAGTRLQEGVLEVRQVPKRDVLPGAMTTLDEAKGRVTRYPLVAGAQVIDTILVSGTANAERGLAFSVPEGMRAVSVPVSEVTGAGGLIVPGDRVDVLVATSYERLFSPQAVVSENERKVPAVVTVLQDVLVLAVGQQFTPAVDTGRDPRTLRTEDASPQPSARSMTLAVSPANAQVLFMAAEEGKLGLAVRAFGDGAGAVLSPVASLQPPPLNNDRANRVP
jgi:pilus assembly protein CpaB